ncbi:MAG: glycosyltransferase [Spirochaetaceae bacterium]
MQYPKISIMIPTYNQEDYIRQNIESVLKLNYPNLEVVLSDDCSTDGTFAIAKEYEKDPRFKAYKCKKNLGRVKNYKHTLTNLITGDWVLNCDGDDYLLETDFFLKAMEISQLNSDIVLFSANRYKFKQNSQKSYLQKSHGIEGEIDGTYFFKNYFNFAHGLLHITSLYNRDIALKSSFYTTDIISSDIDSLLKITIGKKLYHFDDVIAGWRDHDENATKSININQLADNLLLIQSLYEYHKKEKSLPIKELHKWKKQFYKNRVIRVGNRLLSGLKYKVFIGFIKEVQTQGKGLVLPALLSPRLIFTFIFPFRLKIINKFKRLIKGDQSIKG